MSTQETIQAAANAVQHQHVATGVAATTIFGGLITWLMTNAGWMAALAGMCLSIVLIISHIKKGKLDRELLKLQIENARRDNIPS